MSYEKIKRIYDNLPPAEKKMPIISIDGKVYTWEEVIKEIKEGGKLADKMQKKLEELEK